MAFKTFAPGVLTSSDVNTFLMRQAVITCTAATRPASPNEGMTIYETDTDRYASYTGSAWVAGLYPNSWTSYTPTISNGSLGNGTMTGSWFRAGAFVYCKVEITLGSTSTVGTDFGFSGPFAPKAFAITGYAMPEGLVRMADVSLPIVYTGTIGHGAVNIFYPQAQNVTDGIPYLRTDQTTATVPFTWATGDIIVALWGYEANTP